MTRTELYHCEGAGRSELHILRRLDFEQLLEHPGEGMLSHIEATAKARITDTQAKLAALSG